MFSGMLCNVEHSFGTTDLGGNKRSWTLPMHSDALYTLQCQQLLELISCVTMNVFANNAHIIRQSKFATEYNKLKVHVVNLIKKVLSMWFVHNEKQKITSPFHI